MIGAGTVTAFLLSTDTPRDNSGCIMHRSSHRPVEVAAQKIRHAKSADSAQSREPGLSEIVGAVAVIAVAVGAGAAFYTATLDKVETVADGGTVDIFTLRLVVFVPYGDKTDAAYAEMVMYLPHERDVTVSGDINEMTLFDYAHADTARRSGDGIIIHYEGAVELDTPKAVGDSVDIIIRYGNSSRVASTVIESGER